MSGYPCIHNLSECRECEEAQQIAASLGERWLKFYRAVHKTGTASFITDGVRELMGSLALRESAIDHLSSMRATEER